MFVLPFTRCMRICRTQQFQNSLVTSEATPLIKRTENSFSTRAIAREEGHTYISYPMDMSETADICSAQNELGSSA